MLDEAGAIQATLNLIEAENLSSTSGPKAVEDATPLLCEGLVFTSSKGDELGKLKYLEVLREGKPGVRKPQLPFDKVWVQQKLAVVRGVIEWEGKTFRNLWVFEAADGRWCCVAWQVTAHPEAGYPKP
ncbi:hypothetical protein AWB78_02381 [Caballeronia calidae]|jgi:hypothetical protein|uniref:DUF4440 domain-containing protein n=1 Tax=Caballeronia calidae TaxID=1777139 RepID=A0A158B7L3_9BURK|nr:nuclear transport factor 2 family protein [Caballeronia calidae]SAK66075.1 hypothetical protein AWB78_02381 [Caballeronia calidae]